MAAAFHPLLLSGFRQTITDEGDTRHFNYILENGYRWAASGGARADVWSPAVFTPLRNTGPYCDLALGVLPLYAPWRALGAPPDTALQLWMLTAALVNFAAAYVTLRRLLLRSVWASSVGAFLFAFGSIRTAALAHQQLFFHAFTVVAASAAFAVLRDVHERARRRRLWIALLFGGIVGQFYAGFYLGWFLVLALAVALVWGLVLAETRFRILTLVRNDALSLAIAALGSATALWPLAARYLEAARTVESRTSEVAVSMLPKLQAWLYLGPQSWLYGFTASWPVFRHLEPFEWEKRLGLGLATTGLLAWGLWVERRRAGIQVLIASFVTITALVTFFPGGHTFWPYVFRWAPGAVALRAVARVGLLFLVPAAVGIAYALDRISLRRSVAAAVTLLVCLEQGQSQPSYDKLATRERLVSLERALPRDIDAFFYSPVRPVRPFWESQLDAMWVQLETGIPTINGYSCSFPPLFKPLLNPAIVSGADEERVGAALDAWIAHYGLRRERVFWLRPRGE
jgi:hypothetical protein